VTAFLVLFFVPALCALVLFLVAGKRVTLKEFLLMLAAQALVAGISSAVLYSSNTDDVEVWNSRISAKKTFRVSCQHSYQCFCVEVCSGSGSSRSCSQVCQTCYEHDYDVEWHAYTSIGEDIEIDTVDSQGLEEPPRWTQVLVGEPASSSHHYRNYIKASPDTLFRMEGDYQQFAGTLPPYPNKVYDYYRLDRLTAYGVPLDYQAWNQALAGVSADLGHSKQVNVILAVTQDKPLEWFHALERQWLGGKKNDVIIVASQDSGGKLQWVQVMAWAQDDLVKVRLRDDLMALEKLDPVASTAVISRDIQELYVRKHMQDFKYLQASIVPTPTQWSVSLIISLLVTIVLGYIVVTQDLFNEERETKTWTRQSRRRYSR
jgi:hypothetical protein